MSPSVRRQVVFAVVAGLLMIAAIARSLGGRGDAGAPSAVPGRAPRDTAGIVSATRTAGESSLRDRYRSILDADPFRSRSFRRETARAERPRERDAERSGPAAPLPLALRLTGVVAEAGDFSAILEDRPSNRGLLLKKGDRLGERSVAEVRTDSVILAVAIPGTTAATRTATTTLNLGDKIELSRDSVESRLGPVGPPMTASPSRPGSSEPAPQLTDEAREGVLERLRTRRRASMGGEEKK